MDLQIKITVAEIQIQNVFVPGKDQNSANYYGVKNIAIHLSKQKNNQTAFWAFSDSEFPFVLLKKEHAAYF